MDLFYPESASVNDGIDPSLCSLKHILVDMVAQTIPRLEKETLLAKVDIEAIYRLVPVHPQDRQLQAVKWNDRVYADPMLPFGLRCPQDLQCHRGRPGVDPPSPGRGVL